MVVIDAHYLVFLCHWHDSDVLEAVGDLDRSKKRLKMSTGLTLNN